MTAPATISLMTIPEAAEACGGKVSEKAIRGAIINGALDACQPGKAYLIRHEDLERWLTCLARANRPASTTAKPKAIGSSETAAMNPVQLRTEQAIARLRTINPMLRKSWRENDNSLFLMGKYSMLFGQTRR